MAYKPTILTSQEGGTGASNTATSGKILIGDGTNFVSSTPTYPAAAGTSGNVLTSDGTNWISSTTPATAEGTYNPTIDNASSSPTVTYAANGQRGRYCKIGNGVMVTSRVILTAYSAGTGSVQINSLPFTSANVSNQSNPLTVRAQNVTFGASVLWYTADVTVNATTTTINGSRSAATLLGLANTGPSATTDITINGWYSTA